ncbi:ABC transporter permease subunit [Humisphaera borealis]|uniref:ABC transporter permease subunit n=1 Tax=Humisphaera borealis TaxID=2807512 RepID=A0A7M2WWT7_9BACT|nr:ABC transporter permease subunit [Humisphaera borealis]QOV89998.1 ABC transporter permease subunit [Humisphaera borealis]
MAQGNDTLKGGTAAGPAATFTGVARRKTRRSVKVVDAVAKYVISVGGVSVVFAFAAIVFALAAVVVPLFDSPKINPILSVQLARPTAGSGAAISGMALDEYLTYVWTVDAGGHLNVYRTAGGELVKSDTLSDTPTTVVAVDRRNVAVGCADGTVRAGRIETDLQFVPERPEPLKGLQAGQTIAYDGGVASLTPEGLARVFRVRADLSPPLKIGDTPSPIRLLDYSFSDRLEVVVALREDGKLFYSSVVKKGLVKKVKTAESYELPIPPPYQAKKPQTLLVGLNGRMVYLIYADGATLRFNTDVPEKAYVAEELDLLPSSGRSLATASMLLGNTTLIVTDDRGDVTGWFPAPFPKGQQPTTRDEVHMVLAHDLAEQGQPVTAVATSSRDRQFLTADKSGQVVLRHMTSNTTQGSFTTQGARRIQALAFSPNNQAIAAIDDDYRLTLVNLDNPHADASMSALFSPIHYEGYAKPGFVYQSSAGTDDAELKFSLWPLIFGTIKATFYAMLIAVPIAIMAAIYTSEFMQPRVRAVVKPTIELMASLPSVVLGFIGALVFAPLVESWITALLAMLVAIPVGLALFGLIWQTLPPAFAIRVPAIVRFSLMLVATIAIGVVTYLLGPQLERLMFYGDIRGWLASRVGDATPGWVILLSPMIGMALVFIYNTNIRRMVVASVAHRSRSVQGATDVLRFLAIAVVAILIAWALGRLLSSAGFDLRKEFGGVGSVVGTYVQRNSLLVGLFMGFAIIPLIYTVSEDALTSVPGSLRSASLGAGATPWQTAIRVVLPVATSGIFSACMIGFGRAAGETMVMLMMSGRVSLIDLNMFNGFSALAANVATELPEAARDTSHYRILFLSALVLFVITFAVNTTAEIVRMRFRKRAYQL